MAARSCERSRRSTLCGVVQELFHNNCVNPTPIQQSHFFVNTYRKPGVIGAELLPDAGCQCESPPRSWPYTPGAVRHVVVAVYNTAPRNTVLPRHARQPQSVWPPGVASPCATIPASACQYWL